MFDPSNIVGFFMDVLHTTTLGRMLDEESLDMLA